MVCFRCGPSLCSTVEKALDSLDREAKDEFVIWRPGRQDECTVVKSQVLADVHRLASAGATDVSIPTTQPGGKIRRGRLEQRANKARPLTPLILGISNWSRKELHTPSIFIALIA